MIKLLSLLTYISTIMAIVSTLIICVSYFGNTRSSSLSTSYKAINSQIKIYRISSLIFTVLSWLVISGENKQKCLEGYVALSKTCSHLGTIWIIYAFICIVISLVMISIKKDSSDIKSVSKFRNSGFIMGGIFLVCSFILNVG